MMLADRDGPWVHTLQSELRGATRELHHRLDHHGILAPLVSPDCSLAEYQRSLIALRGINAPVEARIAQYVATRQLPFDYAPRQRMADLDADLNHFGLPVGEPAWSGPTIDSDGALIGCLYVLEGSTMGGRVIFRQLAPLLGLTPSVGGRFFNGHGDRTEARWQEFWKFAAVHCLADDLAAARRAACNLFHSYLTLLDRYREH